MILRRAIQLVIAATLAFSFGMGAASMFLPARVTLETNR